MSHLEVFSTDRLSVREWGADDAGVLLAIRRLDEVARWLSDPEPWQDHDTALDAIDGWSRMPRPLGEWAIVPSGADAPVGSVGLRHLPGSDEVHIGWYLHPDATGRGLAAEVAAGAIRYAFRHGTQRVWAVMWPDNLASARVARRAGMTELGVRPDPWYGTPGELDSLMFRADRQEP